jgi:hypothetical protein
MIGFRGGGVDDLLDTYRQSSSCLREFEGLCRKPGRTAAHDKELSSSLREMLTLTPLEARAVGHTRASLPLIRSIFGILFNHSQWLASVLYLNCVYCGCI